jgi:hypothetical protein
MEGWIYICIKCWSHEQKAIASLYDCRNHIGVCYYIRDFGGVEDFADYLVLLDIGLGLDISCIIINLG